MQLCDEDFGAANLPRAFERKRFRVFFKGERGSAKHMAAVRALADLGWSNVPKPLEDSAEEFEDAEVELSQET